MRGTVCYFAYFTGLDINLYETQHYKHLAAQSQKEENKNCQYFRD
jgi:hypothetical protein